MIISEPLCATICAHFLTFSPFHGADSRCDGYVRLSRRQRSDALKLCASTAEYDPCMPSTVGIDLTSLDEVRDSMRTFGRRYLERVYTPRELDECRADPGPLASRFAAKEAAMKALKAVDRLPWHSIAVEGDETGRPALHLRDAAASLARQRGVASVSVTLTSTASYAAAVVVMEAE